MVKGVSLCPSDKSTVGSGAMKVGYGSPPLPILNFVECERQKSLLVTCIFMNFQPQSFRCCSHTQHSYCEYNLAQFFTDCVYTSFMLSVFVCMWCRKIEYKRASHGEESCTSSVFIESVGHGF